MEDGELSAQLATLAGDGFGAWLGQMEGVKGCADPVYLVGHTITRNAAGEVTHVFSSRDQPNGRLAVPCQNRRATRCEPCSYLHAGDTYQVVVTGLAGGKGVASAVAEHPRAFVTLTAPSFGAVHRVASAGTCRPWPTRSVCAHGLPRRCGRVHVAGDVWVGQAVCEACYDFDRAVMWNARAGALWHRFVVRVRREVAAAGGLTQRELGRHARVVFAKVVEYQARGAVHFHAVVRVDGPGGPGDPAPSWVSGGVLAGAVRAAAAHVRLLERGPAGRLHVLTFGSQLDVQPIVSAGGDGMADRAVAGYIAKYVTKGDIPGLTWDRRVTSADQIETLTLGRQGRMLMRACWAMGGRARAWTHQLGYPGHVTTKSPTYSTTYTALRQARREFRRAAAGVVAEPGETREASWEFAGHGLTDAEKLFVRGVSRRVMDARHPHQGEA